MVMVGLLNYGYALLLTHLLSVTAYSTFAAGQGLILWASTVVIVSVPWVLAQALVRAQSDAERNSAIRFAKLAGIGSGIVAAAAAGAIATRFAGSATALVIAFSIFVIFLGTTTTGWLQGRERMSALSALIVVENLVKNGAGVLLVTVAGLGGAGALGAYGIGALVLLACWPRTPRGTGRAWRAALASRDLWRRAVGIAGAQGIVSLFVAIDVVLVALLPGDRALTASYQASAALARVPYYVAGAVALSFFPSLSRRTTGGVIAARAVRMYAAIALPIAVILSTVPAPILATMLPTQYGAVATLLRYTAVTGLAVGGISLVTTFFQAADDYSCLWWLGARSDWLHRSAADWMADRRHQRAGRRRRSRRRGSASTGSVPTGAQTWARGTRPGPPSGASGGGRGAYRAAAVSVAVAGGRISGGVACRCAFRAARSPPRSAATVGRAWKPGNR